MISRFIVASKVTDEGVSGAIAPASRTNSDCGPIEAGLTAPEKKATAGEVGDAAIIVRSFGTGMIGGIPAGSKSANTTEGGAGTVVS